ncbi:MAG: hypothetical protein ACKVLJ_07550 [Cytophagales bacterium]
MNLLKLVLLFSIAGRSQFKCSGYLGKFLITLVMYLYRNGISLAYYSYDNYDSPITINGNLKKEELKLFEKDENNSTTIIFENFEESNKKIKGE